jgi:hypothetical protein
MNKPQLTGLFYAVVLSFALSTPVQAATILFNLTGNSGDGLLPGNEVSPAASTGSGNELGSGISYDDVTNVLSIDIGWGSGNGFTDLTGNVTLSHIHGFADSSTNAGVLYTLHTLPGFDVSATSGGFTGIVNIAEADETNLLAGLTYINVHTSANPGGEVRGQLVVDSIVPIPPAVYLFVSGLIGLVGMAKKRSNV